MKPHMPKNVTKKADPENAVNQVHAVKHEAESNITNWRQQTMQVKWGTSYSSPFTVTNGVR